MAIRCNRRLGRALGYFTFSLIGLKRILFTNIFQRLQKHHLEEAELFMVAGCTTRTLIA